MCPVKLIASDPYNYSLLFSINKVACLILGFFMRTLQRENTIMSTVWDSES